MFGSLGVPELLLIFAVILIVFGPRRIPEIGRTLGKAMGEFRKATDDLKSTIEREVRLEELKKITPPSLEEFMTPAESVSRTAPGSLPADESSSVPEVEHQPAPQLVSSTTERLDDSTTSEVDDSTTPPVEKA